MSSQAHLGAFCTHKFIECSILPIHMIVQILFHISLTNRGIQRELILSFSHTFPAKSARVRSWCPHNGLGATQQEILVPPLYTRLRGFTMSTDSLFIPC